jgi:hypothetical protein
MDPLVLCSDASKSREDLDSDLEVASLLTQTNSCSPKPESKQASFANGLNKDLETFQSAETVNISLVKFNLCAKSYKPGIFVLFCRQLLRTLLETTYLPAMKHWLTTMLYRV